MKAKTQDADTDTLDLVEQRRVEAAAEEERISGIRKLCGAEHGEIAVEAIKAGWSVGQTETEMLRARVARLELNALRAARPHPPGIAANGAPAAPMADILAAAFLGFWGHEKTAERAFGGRVVEEAHGLGARCLADICAECLRAEDRDIPRTASATIRAAFSSNAMEVALTSTADKIVLQAFNDTVPTWRTFSNVVSVRDFKAAKVLRPSFGGELEEVPPGGNLTYGVLTEEVLTDIRAKVFAQIIGVSYQALVNDDASVFSATAQQLGQNAARRTADVVYECLLGNELDFFHADHSNLLEGASSALSLSSLGSAIAAMLTMRDPAGRDLDITPVVLAVPPELRETGLQLVQSETLARYVSETLDQRPQGNPYKGLQLVVESRLSNTVRFENASLTAWYIFARPADAPVNVCFLDGAQVPQVEFFGLSADVDRLGYAWRVYLSMGAALGDYRAAIKSAGV